MCPFKGLRKHVASTSFKNDEESPVFREESGECFTGKKLSLCLHEISEELRERGIQVKNHSFSAGVASLMAALGYKEDDIMASGRWKSDAFMAYTKLPRLHRAKFALNLAKRF